MIRRYTRQKMGSIWMEDTKFNAWLRVQIAVAEAQAERGNIPSHIPNLIRMATGKIDKTRIDEYEARFHHDMNAFLRHISDLIPEEARPYLHGAGALTSYDVEDTALGTLLQAATNQILTELRATKDVLFQMAWRYKDTLQIGRTHGIHAEPITFGFKILNWYNELDWYDKLIELVRKSWEVGKISGAVGTYAHINPGIEEMVCAKLSLSSPGISTQIIPRSRFGLYICILALLAGSLEKFATDIRFMSITEVSEVKERRGAEQQGSSAMPHKSSTMFANPQRSENICSLARFMQGLVIPALENQVTWQERDLANSANERLTFMDASIAVDFMLFRFSKIMEELEVFPDKMRRNLNLSKGMIFSGEVLNALMKKGVSRDEAYNLVRNLVLEAEKQKVSFKKLVVENKSIRALLSEKEIKQHFDPKGQLRHINKIFERFGKKLREN